MFEVSCASHMWSSQPICTGSTVSANAEISLDITLSDNKCKESSNPEDHSGTFIYNSPIQLHSKQGGRRGRRTTAESLNCRSPKQKSIVSFVNVNCGTKRPLLIEEISEDLDSSSAPPPVKRASVSLCEGGGVDWCNKSNASDLLAVSRHSSSAVNEGSFCLFPFAATSSPVKMCSNEDMAEVKGLVKDLVLEIKSMKVALDKQASESDKKLDSLNRLVTSLDSNVVSMNTKVADLERRVAQCESQSLGSSRQNPFASQHNNMGAQVNSDSPFAADIFKMRKFMLKQEREGVRCNAIVRGSLNSSAPAMSIANDFL